MLNILMQCERMICIILQISEVKWRLNILFSIPNSYNSFLLWFYRVFYMLLFLGSGVHLWIVILLFLFVRFQEMLKIYHIFFYLQMINPKIGFILKKISFEWKGTSVDWTIEMTSCGWNRNFATQLISQKIDRLTDVLSMFHRFCLSEN